MRTTFKTMVASAVLSFGLAVAPAMADPENTMVIELTNGEVEILLRPDLAPRHVEQIKALVREGAYDNVAFHRVIEGFMAQTGDVRYGDMDEDYNSQLVGTGGSQLANIPAEFSAEPFVRGTVGMARAQDPNSANSQFFIMFAPADPLNNNYTVIGQVVSGMESVDAVKRGNPAANGSVTDPDRMISVHIAADQQ